MKGLATSPPLVRQYYISRFQAPATMEYQERPAPCEVTMNQTDSVALADPKSSAKSGRREAIGAEIPVTVHASRTNQGLGKNLPSVHEETRTVIVLQQGAVVRMTASLSTGETVVLTNRMTGADVLCRVGNIKSQSGVQHYVDLEFIQRAPGFWGDTVAASSAPLAADAPAATPAPAPLPAIVPNPVAVMPAPVAAPPATVVAASRKQPLAPVLGPPSQSLPMPAAILPMPEPAPTTDVAPPPPPAQLETAPLAEPVAPARKPSHAAPPIPIATTAPSFGGLEPEPYIGNSSGSQKTLVGAAAALLLVLGGAGGGYWFFGRQSNAASSPSMQQAAVPSPVQPLPDLTTISTFAMEPEPSAALSAAASQPPTDAVIQSPPGGVFGGLLAVSCSSRSC